MTYNRNPGFDVVRMVATILIITTHSASILGFDNSSDFLNNFVYSNTTYFGLGLFTMLSGALQMKCNYSVADFYERRFVRILIPFVFWATVVYIISAFIGKYDSINSVRDAVINYIPALLLNRINIAYWYIYLILLLYLITPLLIKVFRNNRKLLAIVLVVWMGVESIFQIKGVAGTVLFYTGLYLLGFFINEFTKRTRVSFLCGMGGFLLLFAASSFSTPGFIDFSLNLASLICLFVGLSSVTRFNLVVQSFSRYSFTIYLTHFIFIRSLFTLFPRFFSFSCFMPILMTTIVVVMEYFFCMFMEKCKFVPNKVVGI